MINVPKQAQGNTGEFWEWLSLFHPHNVFLLFLVKGAKSAEDDQWFFPVQIFTMEKNAAQTSARSVSQQ